MTLKHTYIRTKHQQTPHRDQLPSKTFKKQNRTSKITLSHTNAHEHTRAKQSKAKQSKARKKAKWVQKQTCSSTVSSFFTKVNGKRIKKRLKEKLCRLEGVRERGEGREREGSSPKYH
jgi:hypothetical protein